MLPSLPRLKYTLFLLIINSKSIYRGYLDYDLCPEQVVDGLDRAVKKMKKGEVALVTIQPEYAFGPSETQQELAIIPANAIVDYEVELLSFVKVGCEVLVFL